MQERRTDASAAELRAHSDVVDVNLVEDKPERTEAGDRTLPGARHEDVADRAVLQLPRVHLARPGIGERLGLDLEHAVEIAVPLEPFDPVAERPL